MIVQRTPIAEGCPFDLETVAVHCRADMVDLLSEVGAIASAAALEFESYTQTALLLQTVQVTIEGRVQRSMMALPVAPLADPVSVSITVDGLPFDDFAVIAGLRPALHFSACKPCGLVVIEYQAGFGETHADVPEVIRLGQGAASAHFRSSRISALARIRSLRITAVMASLAGFPALQSRW